MATAAEAAANGQENKHLVKSGARYGRKLIRDSFPSAPPHGHLVVAGVAVLRERRAEALEHLQMAEEQFSALHMPLHAAIARRCAGVATGGRDGQSLIDAADAWMADQRLARPDRVARMLCPGFAPGQRP